MDLDGSGLGGWCKSDNTRWFFSKQANANANAYNALNVDRLEKRSKIFSNQRLAL
jgi:hypothetical protein